ncbi:MAG TPA: hypothetical protein VG501_06480 [Rhizomicrobium sp.]|nr:hypothetical protein [Rhizomicrobium sp.]
MTPVWDVLVYVVLPLWVLAGFADYCCHRAAHMERATGPRESMLHWLMLAQVGLPLVLAVFFRINALLLSLMILAFIAHEITGYIDLRLAMATRKVTAFEHQVHSFLEILPLTAILLVMTLHWPQTLALFGKGSEHADFSLGPKQIPRWGELIPPFAAFLIFALLPYAEELRRGFRAERADQAAVNKVMEVQPPDAGSSTERGGDSHSRAT